MRKKTSDQRNLIVEISNKIISINYYSKYKTQITIMSNGQNCSYYIIILLQYYKICSYYINYNKYYSNILINNTFKITLFEIFNQLLFQRIRNSKIYIYLLRLLLLLRYKNDNN